jgi:hypothetical protein
MPNDPQQSLPYRDGNTGEAIVCENRKCDEFAERTYFDHNGHDWWYCVKHAPPNSEVPEEL